MQHSKVPDAKELDQTWIALNQAVGGFKRGDDGYFDPSDTACRCALVEHDGDALVIEAAEARDTLQVSFRKKTAGGLKDRVVWRIRFTGEYREVCNVADAIGKRANRKSVTHLNDMLWRFRRLAVEDAASVIRN